jgi:single-strand DNA-binding protein
MAGYNRVILIGNLTRDPEYKQLASGQAVCRLGLATNRQFKNRQTGAMVQEVCYIDIDVWGPQAESCRQYLNKGRPVLIEGRLKLDTWEDQNGQNRNKHSVVADRVVFLGAGNNAEVGVSGTESLHGAVREDEMPEPHNEMEKELFDQIVQIKKRSTTPPANKAPKRQTAGNGDMPTQIEDINFQDQPPFQDDLPF